LPFLTTYPGPRTDAAGLKGRTLSGDNYFFRSAH
jgi:hypothetical protein